MIEKKYVKIKQEAPPSKVVGEERDCFKLEGPHKDTILINKSSVIECTKTDYVEYWTKRLLKEIEVTVDLLKNL